jgi:hypothetical protein
MSYSAYPTATDLQELLTSAGVTIGTLETDDYAAAARQEFERRTGRTMLAPGSTAVRYYDPPAGGGQYLDFGQDLAVLTSVVFQPASGSAETLTENTDFWLRPLNAAADGQPYLGLELRRWWREPRAAELHRSIRVTGRWGFGTTLSEEVFSAIKFRAAELAMAAYGLNLSSGRVQSSEAGVVRVWGEEPLLGARRGWREAFETAVIRYQRRVF